MAEQSSVYVVDDDPAVLHSVEALLSQSNYRVICYSNAERFLGDAALDQEGCVISDVQMAGLDGMELLRRLGSAKSPLSVIVVTGVADVPMTVALMEDGALTLLEKPYVQAELLRAVQRALVASHEKWEKQRDEQSVRDRLVSFSEEERAVMKLMLSGAPNKAIAAALNLSMRTVDRRRQTVLDKMGVESVPELATLLAEAHYSPDRGFGG